MSNINVAIADDNERIRHNLKDIVSREQDMTIVGSASDGVDAVSMIRRTHPDVVLLDIIMPKMDGLGVLEEIQKDKEMEKKTGIYRADCHGTGDDHKGGAEPRGMVCDPKNPLTSRR